MTGAMSMIGIGAGAAAAYLAGRFPVRMESIETCAGFLLIGGLMLLGSALPAVL